MYYTLILLVSPVVCGVPNTSEMSWILRMPQRTVSRQIRVKFVSEIIWNRIPMNVYKLESLFIGLNRTECQKADSFWQYKTQTKSSLPGHLMTGFQLANSSWWELTKAKLRICEDIKRKQKCCFKCSYSVAVFSMKTRLTRYISLPIFISIILL